MTVAGDRPRPRIFNGGAPLFRATLGVWPGDGHRPPLQRRGDACARGGGAARTRAFRGGAWERGENIAGIFGFSLGHGCAGI